MHPMYDAARQSSIAHLSKKALELGKAAEHIVCADLILSGYTAYLSDQGLPYDIVVDLGDRLLRVQVKSTVRAKNANARGRNPNFVYNFSVRKRGKKEKGARLSREHCDVVALVALDIRQAGYMSIEDVGTTVALHPPGYSFSGKYKRNRTVSIDGLSFESAIRTKGAVR